MEIRKDVQRYLDDIVEIAYESYTKEMVFIDNLAVKPLNVFKEYIVNKSKDMSGLVYLEEGKCKGYIYIMYGKMRCSPIAAFRNGGMAQTVKRERK